MNLDVSHSTNWHFDEHAWLLFEDHQILFEDLRLKITFSFF